MKSIAFRHIKRMDDDSRGTHAWLVQVQRQGRKSIKMFSDGVWGGKRKALAAARAWRDEQIEPLAQYTHEMWRRNVLRRNNRSGLVGVARYEYAAQAQAAARVFWMASWIDETGGCRTRKFSVKRWGERGAKQKAIEVREREVRRAVAARTAVRG